MRIRVFHFAVTLWACFLALSDVRAADPVIFLGKGGTFPVLWATRDFSFPQPERIVAFSDIHGDFDALMRILEDHKLVDAAGKWIGGNANVVHDGDLVDRGPYSRMVMDLLMRLEREAAKSGGAVHSVLGNHEVLEIQGYTKYAHENDMFYFLDRIQHHEGKSVDSGYQQGILSTVYSHPESAYAKWLRQRPTIVVLGDTLFLHGGIAEWFLRPNAPAHINATTTAWIESYQGLRQPPPRLTSWCVEDYLEESAVWDRSLAKGKYPEEKLDEGMKAQGVKRIVIGHTTQLKGTRMLYGGKVINIDTGISSAYGGPLTSIEILASKDGQTIVNHRIHSRPTSHHPLLLREQGRILGEALAQKKVTPAVLLKEMSLIGEDLSSILAGIDRLPLPKEQKAALLESFREPMEKFLPAELRVQARSALEAAIDAQRKPIWSKLWDAMSAITCEDVMKKP